MSDTNLIVNSKDPTSQFIIAEQVAVFRWTRKTKRSDNVWWNISAILLFLFTTISCFHLTIIGQFLDDIFFSLVFGVFKYLIYVILYLFTVLCVFGIRIRVKPKVFYLSSFFIFIICLYLSDIFLIIDYSTNWRHENLSVISGNIFPKVMNHFWDSWKLSSVFGNKDLNFLVFNNEWFNYHIAGGVIGEFATAIFSYLTIFFPLVLATALWLGWWGLVLKGNFFWFIGIKHPQTKKIAIKIGASHRKKTALEVPSDVQPINLLTAKYLPRHIMFFDASADITINKNILREEKPQTEFDIMHDLDLLRDLPDEDEQGGDLSKSNIAKSAKQIGNFVNLTNLHSTSTHKQLISDTLGSGIYVFKENVSHYIMPSRITDGDDSLIDKTSPYLTDIQRKSKRAILLDNINRATCINAHSPTSDRGKTTTKPEIKLPKTLIIQGRTKPSDVVKSYLKPRSHDDDFTSFSNTKSVPLVSTQTNELVHPNSVGAKIRETVANTLDESKFKVYESVSYVKPPQLLLIKTQVANNNDRNKKNQVLADSNQTKINQLLKLFRVAGTVTSYTVFLQVTSFRINLQSSHLTKVVFDLAADFEKTLMQPVVIYQPDTSAPIVMLDVKNQFIKQLRLADFLHCKKSKLIPYLLKITVGQNQKKQPITLMLGDILRSVLIITSDFRVSINTIHNLLLFCLMLYKPNQLKLLLLDNKEGYFMNYEGLPHLLAPPVNHVTDMDLIIDQLSQERNRRRQLFASNGSSNLRDFNKQMPSNQRLPIWLVVINYNLSEDDRYTLPAWKTKLINLLNKISGHGIYVVMHTNVLNESFLDQTLFDQFDYFLRFPILSGKYPLVLESIIPNQSLLGESIFYFKRNGSLNDAQKINGILIAQQELDHVVQYIRRQQKPMYSSNFDFMTHQQTNQKSHPANYYTPEQEVLYQKIIKYIRCNHKISTFILQTKFFLGYYQAQDIIIRLQKDGYVSQYQSDQSLQVLI